MDINTKCIKGLVKSKHESVVWYYSRVWYNCDPVRQKTTYSIARQILTSNVKLLTLELHPFNFLVSAAEIILWKFY